MDTIHKYYVSWIPDINIVHHMDTKNKVCIMDTRHKYCVS